MPLFGRFSEALPLLSKHGVSGDSVDGIIFDVGASSMQFDMAHRGFSISRDGPLDMRMDGNRYIKILTVLVIQVPWPPPIL